jgi:PKD repeat protein
MKIKGFFTIITCAALLLGITVSSFSQISQGGDPPSFLYPEIDNKIEVRYFISPDMNLIVQEDEENALSGYPRPYRIGVSVPVSLSIENAGTWTNLPDGGKIWRITLVSEGARALGVYYDDFWLPYGGELFLYNENKDQVIGAYTEDNNNSECTFANQLIQGDRVTLEYYQPETTEILPNISISEMAYTYRGVNFDYIERSGSLWCMININCSPEGDDWQDEKFGVVKQFMKIGFYYYLCSGSLMNNTSQDLTPYVLTAWHCGEGASVSDMNQWVFYYKYEASTCTGTWGPQNFTQTGCQKKAEGSYTTGSDFLLLKLNYNVPASCNAYYNGWDRTNIPADSGVNIHHPAGDIKKISTFKLTATSAQWNNNGVLSHWRVWWAETPHGTSITEGGSSGSPLFNQDGRVVGDLTGGPPDDCDNPLNSLYGKVYWSWDLMGSLPSQQLKYWLDPLGSGVEVWDGTYTGTVPSPDFSANKTSIQPGEKVSFTDMTTGNPLEWEWTFEGGTPGSYSGQEPPLIQYDAPGRYNVSLTASNTIGSNTKDSVEMIIVGAPEADFDADNNYIQIGDTVNFTDESTGDPVEWYWEFQGGIPDTSTMQNPEEIIYNASGNYNVMLVATNQYGSDTVVKEEYITVGGPLADFTADVTNILAGESVTFTDLSINDPTSWSWKFFGGSPGSYMGQDPPPVTYNNPGDYDVKLTVSNDLGNNYITKADYIHVGGIGIDENDNFIDGVKIYPNPTSGIVKLLVGDDASVLQSIKVYNAFGKEIRHIEFDKSGSQFEIDLSDQPNGIYFMAIEFENKILNRKVYILR